MAKKRSYLTHTNLRKTLMESLVNPTGDDPTVLMITTGDTDYRISRSVELLIRAQRDPMLADQYLKDAITLIAVARLDLKHV